MGPTQEEKFNRRRILVNSIPTTYNETWEYDLSSGYEPFHRLTLAPKVEDGELSQPHYTARWCPCHDTCTLDRCKQG